jgi:hypothetical protein
LTIGPLLATIEPSEKSDGVRSPKPDFQGNDSYIQGVGIVALLISMISQLFGSDPSHLITQIVEDMKRDRPAK